MLALKFDEGETFDVVVVASDGTEHRMPVTVLKVCPVSRRVRVAFDDPSRVFAIERRPPAAPQE